MVVESVGGVKGSGCGGRERWCHGVGGKSWEAVICFLVWRVDFSGSAIFRVGDFLDFRDIITPTRSRREPPRNT